MCMTISLSTYSNQYESWIFMAIQKATSERVSSHYEVLTIKGKRFVFLCWHHPSFDHKNYFSCKHLFPWFFPITSTDYLVSYVVTHSFSKKLFLFHLVVASNFLQESDQQFGRKFLQRTFKVAALPYSIYSRPIWNFNSNIFLQIKSVYRTRAIITRGLYIFYPIFQCGL